MTVLFWAHCSCKVVKKGATAFLITGGSLANFNFSGNIPEVQDSLFKVVRGRTIWSLKSSSNNIVIPPKPQLDFDFILFIFLTVNLEYIGSLGTEMFIREIRYK